MSKKLLYHKCSEENSIAVSANKTKFISTKSENMIYWYLITEVKK